MFFFQLCSLIVLCAFFLPVLASNVSQSVSCNFQSLNFPEENDETMSKTEAEDTLPDAASVSKASSVRRQADPQLLPADPMLPSSKLSQSTSAAFSDFCSSMSSDAQSSYSPYQPPLGLACISLAFKGPIPFHPSPLPLSPTPQFCAFTSRV